MDFHLDVEHCANCERMPILNNQVALCKFNSTEHRDMLEVGGEQGGWINSEYLLG